MTLQHTDTEQVSRVTIRHTRNNHGARERQKQTTDSAGHFPGDRYLCIPNSPHFWTMRRKFTGRRYAWESTLAADESIRPSFGGTKAGNVVKAASVGLADKIGRRTQVVTESLRRAAGEHWRKEQRQD